MLREASEQVPAPDVELHLENARIAIVRVEDAPRSQERPWPRPACGRSRRDGARNQEGRRRSPRRTAGRWSRLEISVSSSMQAWVTGRSPPSSAAGRRGEPLIISPRGDPTREGSTSSEGLISPPVVRRQIPQDQPGVPAIVALSSRAPVPEVNVYPGLPPPSKGGCFPDAESTKPRIRCGYRHPGHVHRFDFFRSLQSVYPS